EALTFMLLSLLLTVNDAALFGVVSADLDDDSVAGKNADVVPAHLATYVGKYFGACVQLDQEGRVGTCFQDYAFCTNSVLSRFLRALLAWLPGGTRSSTRHAHLLLRWGRCPHHSLQSTPMGRHPLW